MVLGRSPARGGPGHVQHGPGARSVLRVGVPGRRGRRAEAPARSARRGGALRDPGRAGGERTLFAEYEIRLDRARGAGEIAGRTLRARSSVSAPGPTFGARFRPPQEL